MTLLFTLVRERERELALNTPIILSLQKWEQCQPLIGSILFNETVSHNPVGGGGLTEKAIYNFLKEVFLLFIYHKQLYSFTCL